MRFTIVPFKPLSKLKWGSLTCWKFDNFLHCLYSINEQANVLRISFPKDKDGYLTPSLQRFKGYRCKSDIPCFYKKITIQLLINILAGVYISCDSFFLPPSNLFRIIFFPQIHNLKYMYILQVSKARTKFYLFPSLFPSLLPLFPFPLPIFPFPLFLNFFPQTQNRKIYTPVY